MELLGFYDEPFGVRDAARPTPRPRFHAPRDVTPAILDRSHDVIGSTPLPRAKRATVADLWDTTTVDEGLFQGWTPGFVARSKLEQRTFSPSFVVACLLLSALFSAGLWLVTERPARVEATRQAAAVVDIQSVVSSGTALSEVAQTIGVSDGPDVSGVTSAVTTMESDARRLFNAASEDPSAPARALLVEVAGEMLAASEELSGLMAFQVISDRALFMPALPVSATPEQVPDLTAAIASWRVETASAVESLPANTLPEHASTLRSWVTEMEQWQGAYIDSVLTEDATLQTELLDQQVDRIERIRSAILGRIASVAQTTTTDLDAAVDRLEASIAG